MTNLAQPDDDGALPPRWCMNRLTVAGAPPDRAEFRAHARGRSDVWPLPGGIQAPEWPDARASGKGARSDGAGGTEARAALSPDALLPPPAPLRAVGPPAVAGGGASAALDGGMAERWGTSGDLPPTTRVHEHAGALRYEFMSPGGAPEAWVESVFGRFPDLEFTLEHLCSAACDAGYARYAGGRLLEPLAAPDVVSVEAFARRRFGVVLDYEWSRDGPVRCGAGRGSVPPTSPVFSWLPTCRAEPER